MHPLLTAAIRSLAFLVVAVAGVGCGSCGAQPPGSVPVGGECQTAADCQDALVCDPRDGACAGEIVCDVHSRCGPGAVCSADAVCARDTPGGGDGDDCATTANCDDGLVCDPQNDACARDVPCTLHMDCGALAACTVDETCAQSAPGGPCDVDQNCVVGETCFAGICIPEGCTGEEFTAEAVPPNVLIVLDRSGSMDEELDNSGGASKWDVAKDAIAELVATHGDAVRFGLLVYPGTDLACDEGGDCSEGVVPVDIGLATADAITDYVQTSGTCNFRTPTAEALRVALDLQTLHDTGRGNFILLITDGAANCDDPVPDVLALHQSVPPVDVYVVGFGSGIDEDQLTDMAEAGGKALPDDPSFYLADDPQALDAAFAAIVGDVLGCDYALDDAPADPDELYIYFDGVQVPRDPTRATGWDYDSATVHVQFHGNACDALRFGIVEDLVIVYGCPIDGPQPQADAGPAPIADDAGTAPGRDCEDRCVNGCGSQACLLDRGACGACRTDGDCCGGSLCDSASGACIYIGG